MDDLQGLLDLRQHLRDWHMPHRYAFELFKVPQTTDLQIETLALPHILWVKGSINLMDPHPLLLINHFPFQNIQASSLEQKGFKIIKFSSTDFWWTTRAVRGRGVIQLFQSQLPLNEFQ